MYQFVTRKPLVAIFCFALVLSACSNGVIEDSKSRTEAEPEETEMQNSQVLADAGCNIAINPTPQNHTDCSQKTFEDIALDGIDLRYADLSASKFINITWRHAKFSGANLSYSTFEHVDLSGGNFEGATFAGSTFIGAKFPHANLENAIFDGSRAPLAAPSDRVLFPEANLKDASFQNALWQGNPQAHASFAEANLTGTNFSGTKLQYGDFTKANFSATGLIGTDLTNANLAGASLYLTNATSAGADLSRARISNKSIVAGSAHTCARKYDGTVWCWGLNDDGQLGNGTTASSNIPTQVVGLHDVTDISAGGWGSCAVLRNGTSYCWGGNQLGQLGNNSNTDSPVPVRVLGLNDVRSISSGSNHTCAVKHDNTAQCWGNNSAGQVGNNNENTHSFLTPVRVVGPHSWWSGQGNLTNVAHISAGTNFTCATMNDGGVYCWGADTKGQLGTVLAQRDTGIPRKVTGLDNQDSLKNVIGISAGGFHACAISHQGSVLCWGLNRSGALGNNTNEDKSFHPVRVVGLGGIGNLDHVAAISANTDTTCTTIYDGTATCWGANQFGQLGNNAQSRPSAYPVQVVGPGGVGSLANVADIAVGDMHACAIQFDGAVLCWGNNGYRQLGDPNVFTSPTPVPVLTQVGPLRLTR